MIHILKSQNADSRTMTGEPNKSELLKSSVMHIGDVQKGMAFMARKILEAGENHDHTIKMLKNEIKVVDNENSTKE